MYSSIDIYVSFIVFILFFIICRSFYRSSIRFYKAVLIGIFSMILFMSQNRIFYTSPNGTSFTFWEIYNHTYVIPYKYYGLFPPLFSDYIKPFTSDQYFDTIFDFYIDIKDKIILVPNSSSTLKKKLLEVNNKNNSFIIMTEEEIKEYINNHPGLEYIFLSNTNFITKHEYDKYMSGYQKKSNGQTIQLYKLDYNLFNNYNLIFILLFCFLFVTTIIYTVMYLRNYDLQSYSNNLFKAILMDGIEFFLANVIFYCVTLVVSFMAILFLGFLLFSSFKFDIFQ